MVVNKYKVNMNDPDIIYIGRGSIWGNPYSHKTGTKAEHKVDTREEAVEAYKQYLWKQLTSGVFTKEMILSLDGKRLACYCAPQACHGDILMRALRWAKSEGT